MVFALVVVIVISSISIIYNVTENSKSDLEKALNSTLKTAHLAINKQFTQHKETVTRFRIQMADKLSAIRDNDLKN